MQATKVYEFKLNISKDDAALIDRWMQGLAVLWNEGHALMLDEQQRSYRKKLSNPVPPSLRMKWKKGKIVGSGIWKTKGGHKFCPVYIPKPCDDPRKEISKIRSQKNWHHKAIDGVPSQYRDGVIQRLKDSWSNYFNPNHPAKMPKFKGGQNRINSLLNRNGATTVKVHRSGHNGYVKLPMMQTIKVKRFYKRFPNGLNYGSVCIVREAGSYYIQFTAKVEKPEIADTDAKPIGVDPGVKAIVATSEGQLIKPRKNNVVKYGNRLKRLSRKLARQKKDSGQWKRTQVKLAQTHAKIARNRKTYNQKLADWLGRFDVSFEGSKLQNMTRRAKPRLNDDGTGYERNNAKAKSGLNRALLDSAIGQLRVLTEARCDSRGNLFIKTEDKDVRYSSQTCHGCGIRGKRTNQETFLCLSETCKFFNIRQHADVNAAKNHKRLGFNLPLPIEAETGSGPSAMGSDMQVESEKSGVATRGTGHSPSSTTLVPCEKSQGSVSVKDNEPPKLPKPKSKRGSSQSPSKKVLESSTAKVSARSSSKGNPGKQRSNNVLAKSVQTPLQLRLLDCSPNTG